MLTGEQAYKNYLFQWSLKIDQIINDAIHNLETHAELGLDTPKERINKLKEYGYNVTSEKNCYKISWDENK